MIGDPWADSNGRRNTWMKEVAVFQVHGVDAGGAVVVRRRLTRGKVLPFFEKLPPCLVGLEACATAYYWGRELRKLGHDVRLMPPSYVKPYVKRQKNDAPHQQVEQPPAI
jgi:transposase